MIFISIYLNGKFKCIINFFLLDLEVCNHLMSILISIFIFVFVFIFVFNILFICEDELLSEDELVDIMSNICFLLLLLRVFVIVLFIHDEFLESFWTFFNLKADREFFCCIWSKTFNKLAVSNIFLDVDFFFFSLFLVVGYFYLAYI